jgi:hypothetical protein
MKKQNMKTFKYIALAALCAMSLASCSNDDNDSAPGSPVMTPSTDITSAQFGDSIPFTINVKDEGNIPLSTLKAFLYYGDELVSTTVIRTKTYGDYTGKVYAPFYKNIPNGTASLKFVLQNIHFTKVEKDYDVALTRPKYASITLNVNNGDETYTKYTMTPDASNPYLFTTTVNSTSNTVKGYVEAPASGSNGNKIDFGMDSGAVTQGSTSNISFINASSGNITITFNTYTYEYTPLFQPVFNNTNMTYYGPGTYTYYGTLTQGQKYSVSGANDAMSASDWYYDPDFFTKNSDGTYTFNAVTGSYMIAANFTMKCFLIYAMKDASNKATLNSDGTGALWIIGSDGIGKPYYQYYAVSWNPDKGICMAQVKKGVYQTTLTVGQQLKASDVNFKFFHQAGWGLEFDGAAGSTYQITTTSTVFYVGDDDSTNAAEDNGHDNGNIYVYKNAVLNAGDTYVLTVDCSAGISKATFTVTKK